MLTLSLAAVLAATVAPVPARPGADPVWCTAYISMTQWPGDTGYATTEPYTVAFGFSGPQGCMPPGEMDANSFSFRRLPRTTLTSYFSINGTQAVAAAVPMLDEETNSMRACITWTDWSYNEYTICDEKATYVDTTPAPLVSTTRFNNDAQQLGRCAASCFDAAYAHATVPYFTLDAPRNVTLVHTGARVWPRPFILVDVTHPGGTVPQRFWLQFKIAGAFQEFTNGETTLHFAGTAQQVRLAGQLRDSTRTTGVVDAQIVVTSDFGGGNVQATVVDTKLLVVNEAGSRTGRGWTVAGIQRAYVQPDGSVLITEGDGSALYFHSPQSASYTTPLGDFSRLTISTYPVTTYTRAYPDSTKVLFDATGRMKSITDRLGNTITANYDEYGRLTTIEDPTSTAQTPRAISFGYAGLSYAVVSITDPMGRATYLRVNADSTLRAVVDPDGDSTRFAYDGNRRLLKIFDRGGDSTRFVYRTPSALLDSIVGPPVPISGGASQSPTVALGPWQIVSVPTGSTSGTPFTATATASVQGSVRDPEGHTTTFTADRWGQPLVLTDPLSRATTYLRDGNGLLTEAQWPWGGVDAYTYNLNGQVIQELPSEGGGTTYGYGVYAQPNLISGSGQPAIEAYLNAGTGLADSIRYGEQDSIKTRFAYDGRGRVTERTDPSSHTTYYHYDTTLGNLDSARAPGDRYWRVRFDRFGRDSVAQVQTEPWQKVLYDALNRPTEVYDTIGATPTRLTYDRRFLVRVQDPANNVYKFAYSALGWLERRYDTADTTLYEAYRYDRDGALTGWTNRRNQALSHSYDALHRLLAKTGTNAVADSFAYSTDGRRFVAWNALVRDSVFLNIALNPDSVVTRLAGQRFRLRHHFGPSFLLDSTLISSSTSVTFAARRYMRRVQTQWLDSILVGTQATRFIASAEGRFEQTTWMTSPSLIRTRRFTTTHGLQTDSLSNSTLTNTLGRGYGYDGLSRITRQLMPGRVSTYGRDFIYDGLGRLSYVRYGSRSWCSSAWPIADDDGWDCLWAPTDSTITYSYDAVGNRLDQSGSYGAGSRIQSFAGTSYQHDADGNVRQRGSTSFYWSAEGRLDSVVSGGTKLSYGYDASGRLLRRASSGSVRYFLWDGDQLLAEMDSSGSGLQRVGEYAYYPAIDQPQAIITGATGAGTTRYYVQDALSNVIGIVAGSTEYQRLTYDAWGYQQQVAGAVGDTNRLRWKGLVWDGDITGLYYMRNRWYDPATGRFVNEDPIGLSGGPGVYGFALQNPVGGFDPFGLDAVVSPCLNPEDDRYREDCGPLQEITVTTLGWGWLVNGMAVGVVDHLVDDALLNSRSGIGTPLRGGGGAGPECAVAKVVAAATVALDVTTVVSAGVAVYWRVLARGTLAAFRAPARAAIERVIIHRVYRREAARATTATGDVIRGVLPSILNSSSGRVAMSMASGEPLRFDIRDYLPVIATIRAVQAAARACQ